MTPRLPAATVSVRPVCAPYPQRVAAQPRRMPSSLPQIVPAARADDLVAGFVPLQTAPGAINERKTS
jgi:hypothetical protein